MRSKDRTIKNYVFNNEYEKKLLGCVFRNPERVHDIDKKYPCFVEEKNQGIFQYLKKTVTEENLTIDDDIYIPKCEHTTYLLELESITPTDGNFELVLKDALDEKALREYVRSSYEGLENIFRTPDISQFLESKKQELENIEHSIDVEPVPEENTESELTFPYEIIDGIAGDYATIYTEHFEGAKEFFYLSFMTCLGNLFGNSVTLRSELDLQPRLYTLLIGQSADARKSTILNKTIEIFKESIHGYKTTWGVGSAEGLINIIDENEPLLMLFDEFKAFISKCKIDSSVLLPMVTSLFESNVYETHTKKNAFITDKANLSILGASTIATYETMWTPNFLNIGFLNRLFVVPGDSERKFSVPREINAGSKQRLKNGIQNLTQYVASNKGTESKLVLPINDDARELYDKWYLALPRTEYNKRLDTYALKFMILLTINIQKTAVDSEIVKKVIKLMDWQYQVRKAYDPIDAENCMAKMEQSIRTYLQRKPGQKDWELKRGVGANRAGLWIYKNALKNLLEAKEIKIDKQKRWWILEEK